MTPREISAEIDRVCRRDWHSELAPLLERLRQCDPVRTFHSLFGFAAHSQDAGPAAPAALLLFNLKPPCPISCEAGIRELLVDWDVSIEEVPLYFAEQFGVSRVREVVAAIRTSPPMCCDISRLDTIEYWLRCYEESRGDRVARGNA
ncbi:MAG: hypothetical protein FJ405_12045 [Verrucomicrobia bacterium]|nr:hypothetical protein [Verrucomicrobiota bacterium]